MNFNYIVELDCPKVTTAHKKLYKFCVKKYPIEKQDIIVPRNANIKIAPKFLKKDFLKKKIFIITFVLN
jgi:hypothetical protein